MKNWLKRNTYMLICILIEAVILFTTVLFLSKNHQTISLPLSQASPEIGRIESDGYYFDMEAAEQVKDTTAPIPFHLNIQIPKGAYSISIKYRSGAGSTCGLTSASAANAVKCDEIALNHGITEQTANILILKDLSDVDFYVKYCGYKTFIIESITLTGSRHIIPPAVLILLALFVFCDLIIFLLKNKITPANNTCFRILLCLFGITCLASIPLYSSYLPLMDDFAFSYIKIEGIKDGLLEGQFPVRIHPNTQLGYGYALSYFYPELFLYFPAMLRIIGFSIMTSYKIFVFFVNFATAIVSYYSFYRIFKSRNVGLLGGLLYTFSIYRLIDVYRRASIGEYLAMVFLPLIIAGFYRILTEDTRKEQYKLSFLPLLLGLTGLANSHILSCEMAGIFIIFACLLCIKRVLVKERLFELIKAALGTFLLTLYFWIPFFDMLRRDSYKVFTQTPYSISANALSLYKYLTLFVEKNGTANISPTDAVSGDFSLGIVFLIGLAAFLIIILFVVLLSFLEKSFKWHTAKITDASELLRADWLKASLVCALLGILAIYMTSVLFPWKQLEAGSGLLKQLLCMVQFPWRYLSLVTVLLTAVVCGLCTLLTHLSVPKQTLYLFGIGILCITAVQTAHFYRSIPLQSEHQQFYDDAGLMVYRGTGMGEYEPSAFVDIDVDKDIFETQEMMNPNYAGERDNGTGLMIESFEKSGTNATVVVANTASDSRILYLPYIYYYGYRLENVFNNGDGLVPQLIESEKGTLAASIPAGYYNGIHITYQEPLLYRIAEVLSGLALLGVALYYKRKQKNLR